uniref:Uncharacterized protein n=1 Tax=Globisporangium ultimum (strain ATCC 200006 / CBS 805.95 / DAOM BR144) TaxID=431595 RepID=K3XCK2_GLOUD
MKLPLRRIIILLFNIVSTWLTLFTGLRENPVIVYITGKYDYMRSRMIDGGVNYNNIRPALIEPGVLVDLAEAGKNYRFFSAPTRTTKNLLEDRSICMRLDSINGSVLDVYFDDFWGKGPRRTGVTVYSISAPSCKVINLKPKWVTDCIQNHGNASQCHHHILENFEDLQQDHSIQSASTSDFGVKGAPFLKCLERPEQDFPYLTDALLFHNYWAGGSRHLEFTTSNCMAKFLVREKNWKWSLFQTSSVDDRGAMVFAIENSGWFTILVNFFYGFVSIALIIHGLFALAAQEKRVLYVPRVQRFVNDTKYFKFLFPSMMVPITFPDDDTTVVQFKGSVIMGSDVWMNHWLYIAMSILDAVVNIRSTYVIFQTGTFLVGRKANLENFLFLASSLTKTTWLMCFVHTVVRWALKIIARALKNIRMVHPSVREKLDWYADA